MRQRVLYSIFTGGLCMADVVLTACRGNGGAQFRWRDHRPNSNLLCPVHRGKVLVPRPAEFWKYVRQYISSEAGVDPGYVLLFLTPAMIGLKKSDV